MKYYKFKHAVMRAKVRANTALCPIYIYYTLNQVTSKYIFVCSDLTEDFFRQKHGSMWSIAATVKPQLSLNF